MSAPTPATRPPSQSRRDHATEPRSARVAVVIVTYHSADVLAGCLAALREQAAGTLPIESMNIESMNIELTDVVVADNASTDQTLAVAAQPTDLPLRTINLGRNAGYAAAINAGIAALDMSTVDAVLVLNPDCRLRPGSLARLASTLAEDDTRGIAVPKLVNPDGSLQPTLRPYPPSVHRALAESLLGGLAGRWSLGDLSADPARHEIAGPTSWATGAAMLVAARTVARVGEWDESFLLYIEETEYCLRAADKGLITWFEPAAEVEHIGGDQHRSAFLTKLAVVNRVTLFRRRHHRLHAALFFAAVALGEGLRALAGRATARAAFTALVRPSYRVRELPTVQSGPPVAGVEGH